MGALGNTAIKDNENIGALFEQPKRKEIKDDGKLKHNLSAKLTDEELEMLTKIGTAIGTDNKSKALRWCIRKVWELQGEEIEKIAEKKMGVGTL